jgi:hypothetical protein
MGGKAKAPAPPDYSAVAAASEAAAKYNFQLGQDQLEWAKKQYASDSGIVKQVVDASLARQNTSDQSAATDRARYEKLYQPLEDRAIDDANSYSSQGRQDYEAGRAGSTVAQQFDGQRKAAAQNLEAFGVDPSSTRFAALDATSRIQEGAAVAGAENQARTQTDAMGRALRSEAINVGRGYPGQVAGTYGTALQSGMSAANSALAGTASGASTMGTNAQYQGLANGAVGQWGNTLNNGYNNQLNQFNANQQASSGIGSLLGAGLGMAMSFENGGAIGAGDVVPPSASPSRGAAIDDVPAAIGGGGKARINVGEFIVPQDVVDWKGEEFFQKLIEGSRKSKVSAPAKPSYGIPTSGPQNTSPRPTSAIPTR